MKIGIFSIHLPINSSLDIKNEFDLDFMYHVLGYNTGNMLFLNAVLSFICHDKNDIERVVNFGQSEDYYDVIIYPAANIIGTHNDDNSLRHNITLLKKFNCKLLVFGLGAQIHYENIMDNILSQTLIEYLNLLSNKANKLFLRCENTQKILNMLNIKNTVVCGCPSILLNCNSELGNIIENKINYLRKNIKEIKLTLTYQNINNKSFNKIAELSNKCDAPIIIQENIYVIKEVFLRNNLKIFNTNSITDSKNLILFYS